MSERDNIESVVASVNGLQEIVIPAVSATKHLQLVFPDNTESLRHIMKQRLPIKTFTLVTDISTLCRYFYEQQHIADVRTSLTVIERLIVQINTCVATILDVIINKYYNNDPRILF